VTEIGLLAQGRNVIWVQDASELDEGDWVLYESLKNDSTFKPPVSMTPPSSRQLACVCAPRTSIPYFFAF